MRVWLVLLPIFLPSAAVAAPVGGVALSSLSGFDLADLHTRVNWAALRPDIHARSWLMPDLGAPPGEAKPPAKIKIHGRKIRLRIPLG